MRTILILVQASFAFFVAAAVSVLASSSHPEVGKPAPKVEVAEWVQGEIEGKDPFAGRTVILEFWATWCGPCLVWIPHFNELSDKFASDEVVFVSMSSEKRDKVEKFLAKRIMKSCVVLDRIVDDEGYTHKAFGVTGIPHTFLIDNQGILRWHGYPSDLTAEVLEKYFKTGEVPEVRETTRDNAAGGQVGPNTVFSLTISRSLTVDPKIAHLSGGVVTRHLRDTLQMEFQKYSVPGVISRLLGQLPTRARVDGEMPDELIDLVLRVAPPLDDSLAKVRAVETLCDVFGIRVNRRLEPRKGWRLLCPNQNKLEESESKGSSARRDASRWIAEGATFDQLAEVLESIFGQLVFNETNLDGQYNFVLPMGNFAETKKALERNYSIFLEETTRELESVVLTVAEQGGKE